MVRRPVNSLSTRVDLPAELFVDGDKIGKGSRDGKTDFLEVEAVVGIPIAAGDASAAPDHLFGGDHVALFKVSNLLPHFNHLA